MTDTAITRRADAAPESRAFTPQQIRLLQRQLMPQASDGDVEFFVAYCTFVGLDPFSGQVWPIPQQDRETGQVRWRPFTGIDGLRLVAERTQEYQGSEVVFKRQGGPWVEVWEDDDSPPYAAKATVYRLGRRPVPRTVKYLEFVRTNRRGEPMGKWASSPAHMMSIRAESHALRAAFPRETSGLRIDESAVEVINPDAEATNLQKGELMRLAGVLGYDTDERHERAGVESFRDLTKGTAARLIDAWRELAEHQDEPEDEDDIPAGDEVEPDDLEVDVEPEAPTTQGARTAAASGSTFDEDKFQGDAPASVEQTTRLVTLFGGGQTGGNKALRFARTLLGDQVSSLQDLNADQAAALIMRRAGGGGIAELP